jgi:integrase
MAQTVNRLSARAVATLSRPGRHADGGGLYLSISKDGTITRRRWVFLFRWHGKVREMGLGSAATVSLAEVRALASKWRGEVNAGRNPLESREAELRANQNKRTFGEVAAAFYAAKSHEWRNEKVRKQWMTPLNRYAASIMSMSVSEITTGDVVAVLQPIWTSKQETARRVRARIEAILDAARARGLIAPDVANVARWRGHLSHLLPKHGKLSRGHHAAMPYADVPDFMSQLREREAMSASALEFLILTTARTGEVLGARWREIDLDAGIWIVPANRMKGAREHRVPLSDRAIELLARLYNVRRGELVFPSAKPNRPLSGMAMEMCLRRMGVDGVTVHGFRSSFRDWAGDRTEFPRELAEGALAHVAGDDTERAYRRGDALERRRQLMQAWAKFCIPDPSSNVVHLLRPIAQ